MNKKAKMPELIDRQSALSVCKEYCLLDDDDFIDGYNTAIKDIREAIKELPTVNSERQYGRWILERKPDGTPYCLHCSKCDPDFAVIYNGVATDYCPDCGAKMETDRVYERDDYDGNN